MRSPTYRARSGRGSDSTTVYLVAAVERLRSRLQGSFFHERTPSPKQVGTAGGRLDGVRVHVSQSLFSVADGGRGRGMLGALHLRVSCARVPAQTPNCPQHPIRAGGRAGGQRGGSSSINPTESTGCGCDGGGPPFTLSPRSGRRRTCGSPPSLFLRRAGLERRSPDRHRGAPHRARRYSTRKGGSHLGVALNSGGDAPAWNAGFSRHARRSAPRTSLLHPERWLPSRRGAHQRTWRVRLGTPASAGTAVLRTAHVVTPRGKVAPVRTQRTTSTATTMNPGLLTLRSRNPPCSPN